MWELLIRVLLFIFVVKISGSKIDSFWYGLLCVIVLSLCTFAIRFILGYLMELTKIGYLFYLGYILPAIVNIFVVLGLSSLLGSHFILSSTKAAVLLGICF